MSTDGRLDAEPMPSPAETDTSREMDPALHQYVASVFDSIAQNVGVIKPFTASHASARVIHGHELLELGAVPKDEIIGHDSRIVLEHGPLRVNVWTKVFSGLVVDPVFRAGVFGAGAVQVEAPELASIVFDSTPEKSYQPYLDRDWDQHPYISGSVHLRPHARFDSYLALSRIDEDPHAEALLELLGMPKELSGEQAQSGVMEPDVLVAFADTLIGLRPHFDKGGVVNLDQ